MSATSGPPTLAIAIATGMIVSVACERLRVPPLLPLLGAGLLLGSSGVGVLDASSLGGGLSAFITVAIGLLIFEGTLHLNREELSHAPGAVRGLLTIGALVTWVGAAAAAWFTLGFTFPGAALLGATLIVTGPTVVQPILRRMRVTPRLHTALNAEAVFIDPLGVVATVATLEIVRAYVATGATPDLWMHAAWAYVKPLAGGALVGAIVGVASYWALKMGVRRRPDAKRLNMFFLGICMASVGLGELVSPEAGLGAVTVTGLILARLRILGSTELRAFKEQIASILVATLFILLASRFQARSLAQVGWSEAAFVAALVFLVRPLGVVLSTVGSNMRGAERVFASFFAPRGIVALSVASIAGTELADLGAPGAPAWVHALASDAARMESIMFLVIVCTVFLAAVVSPFVARALGVRAGPAGGVIMVGGHALALATARALRARGVPVRIVDTNGVRVDEAKSAGLTAFQGDATDSRWLDDVVVTPEFGWVIAWTGNKTVDRVVARWSEERLGAGHAGVWSDGGAEPDVAPMEIAGGRLLSETIEAVEHGRLEVVAVPAGEDAGSVFGSVEDGQFRIRRPVEGAGRGSKVKDVVWVGVRVPAGAVVAGDAGTGVVATPRA